MGLGAFVGPAVALVVENGVTVVDTGDTVVASDWVEPACVVVVVGPGEVVVAGTSPEEHPALSRTAQRADTDMQCSFGKDISKRIYEMKMRAGTRVSLNSGYTMHNEIFLGSGLLRNTVHV